MIYFRVFSLPFPRLFSMLMHLICWKIQYKNQNSKLIQHQKDNVLYNHTYKHGRKILADLRCMSYGKE